MVEKKYNNISDGELLDEFRLTKNNLLLGILLQRYTLLLLGTCMKYLKNENDAKDAVQQVFLKAINEIPKYQITFFKSWIYMVAKNHCLMQLRSKNIVTEITETTFAEETFDIEKIKQKEQDYNFLETAIDELNNEQKICIELFYLKKKSYNEIVGETGFTLMQVKSYIQNGKRNLKILIENKRMQQ